MTRTFGDEFLLALVAWRENRGGLIPGMQSVMNVVINNAARTRRTIPEEILHPWRYSSMTAPGDPQLTKWPDDGDPRWLTAQRLAAKAVAGELADITHGATNFYAPGGVSEAPAWAHEMEYLTTVAGERFYR